MFSRAIRLLLAVTVLPIPSPAPAAPAAIFPHFSLESRLTTLQLPGTFIGHTGRGVGLPRTFAYSVLQQVTRLVDSLHGMGDNHIYTYEVLHWMIQQDPQSTVPLLTQIWDRCDLTWAVEPYLRWIRVIEQFVSFADPEMAGQLLPLMVDHIRKQPRQDSHLLIPSVVTLAQKNPAVAAGVFERDWKTPLGRPLPELGFTTTPALADEIMEELVQKPDRLLNSRQDRQLAMAMIPHLPAQRARHYRPQVEYTRRFAGGDLSEPGWDINKILRSLAAQESPQADADFEKLLLEFRLHSHSRIPAMQFTDESLDQHLKRMEERLPQVSDRLQKEALALSVNIFMRFPTGRMGMLSLTHLIYLLIQKSPAETIVTAQSAFRAMKEETNPERREQLAFLLQRIAPYISDQFLLVFRNELFVVLANESNSETIDKLVNALAGTTHSSVPFSEEQAARMVAVYRNGVSVIAKEALLHLISQAYRPRPKEALVQFQQAFENTRQWKDKPAQIIEASLMQALSIAIHPNDTPPFIPALQKGLDHEDDWTLWRGCSTALENFYSAAFYHRIWRWNGRAIQIDPEKETVLTTHVTISQHHLLVEVRDQDQKRLGSFFLNPLLSPQGTLERLLVVPYYSGQPLEEAELMIHMMFKDLNAEARQSGVKNFPIQLMYRPELELLQRLRTIDPDEMTPANLEKWMKHHSYMLGHNGHLLPAQEKHQLPEESETMDMPPPNILSFPSLNSRSPDRTAAAESDTVYAAGWRALTEWLDQRAVIRETLQRPERTYTDLLQSLRTHLVRHDWPGIGAHHTQAIQDLMEAASTDGWIPAPTTEEQYSKMPAAFTLDLFQHLIQRDPRGEGIPSWEERGRLIDVLFENEMSYMLGWLSLRTLKEGDPDEKFARIDHLRQRLDPDGQTTQQSIHYLGLATSRYVPREEIISTLIETIWATYSNTWLVEYSHYIVRVLAAHLLAIYWDYRFILSTPHAYQQALLERRAINLEDYKLLHSFLPVLFQILQTGGLNPTETSRTLHTILKGLTSDWTGLFLTLEHADTWEEMRALFNKLFQDFLGWGKDNPSLWAPYTDALRRDAQEPFHMAGFGNGLIFPHTAWDLRMVIRLWKPHLPIPRFEDFYDAAGPTATAYWDSMLELDGIIRAIHTAQGEWSAEAFRDRLHIGDALVFFEMLGQDDLLARQHLANTLETIGIHPTRRSA